MGKLIEFLYEGHRAFHFACPGCRCNHFVPVEGPKAWQWNGSLTAPTFAPSVLVRSATVCHFYVRAGHIEYLPDCHHELAGKTVPMEECWPMTFVAVDEV